MRKGTLLISKIKTIKPGDTYFDVEAKVMIKVTAIEDGKITGTDPNGEGLMVIHADSDNLYEILVQDIMTEELFILSHDQQSYMYKSGMGNHFQFYDRKNELLDIQEAVVFAKTSRQISLIDEMAAIGNSYGKYVAGQKSINEPAKGFADWHFDVSV